MSSCRITIMLLIQLMGIGSCAYAKLYGHDTLSLATTGFVPNKGQWEGEIRYKYQQDNTTLYYTDSGWWYVHVNKGQVQALHEIEDSLQMVLRHGNLVEESVYNVNAHAYRVSFIGGNMYNRIQPVGKRAFYHNYFLGSNPDQWRSRVPVFESLLHKDIYPQIDLSLKETSRGVKYDWIVQPGANYRQIQQKIDGATVEINEEGNLLIEIGFEAVVEQKPLVYQVIKGDTQLISATYELRNNILSYNIGHYDKRYSLIIDPEVVFATYSGGNTSGTFRSQCGTYDMDGHLYAGSETVGAGLPATTGSYQVNYAGNRDCGIYKFHTGGNRLLFCTYFGGGLLDLPLSLAVNKQNELIIAGYTYSKDLPIPGAAYQPSIAQYCNAFVAKLSAKGDELLASTYLGYRQTSSTVSAMFIKKMELDNDDNIWVALEYLYPGIGQLPTTTNAYIYRSQVDDYDVALAQLSPNLDSLNYCSYLGGQRGNMLEDFIINKRNELYFSLSTLDPSITTRNNNLLGRSGTERMNNKLIGRFDVGTHVLLQSGYLSSRGLNDLKLASDKHYNIYLVGYMQLNENKDTFHATAWTPDFSQILKGIRHSNTPIFDGRQSKNVLTVVVDECDRLYLGNRYKAGRNANTVDSFPYSTGFWFGVISADMTALEFATNFGTAADHNHEGHGRFDPYGFIYQNVCSESPDFPTVNAAFPRKGNAPSSPDNISYKIRLSKGLVRANAVLPVDAEEIGCVPYTLKFENYSYADYPVTYTWNFDDGTAADTSLEPTHTFTRPGTYWVKLHAYSPQSCNVEAWDSLKVTVFPVEPIPLHLRDTLVCSVVDSLSITAEVEAESPSYRWRWTPENLVLAGSGTSSVVIQPPAKGYLVLKVTDESKFCSYGIDSAHIEYYPKSLELLNADTVICEGDSIALVAIVADDYRVRWRASSPIANDTLVATQLLGVTPGRVVMTASHPLCGDTSDSFLLGIDTLRQLSWWLDREQLCIGEAVQLHVGNIDSSIRALRLDVYERYMIDLHRAAVHTVAFDEQGRLNLKLYADFRACPDTSTDRVITVHAIPDVYLGEEERLCGGKSSITLRNRVLSTSKMKYQWSTADTTEALEVKMPGKYSLTLFTESGCSNTGSIVVSKDCYTDVPNAFTPNGDGINDYFFPRQFLSKGLRQFRLQILNRWGQTLFETRHVEGRGWDGYYNGQIQPAGVYVYLIEAELDNGQQERYQGNITLMR